MNAQSKIETPLAKMREPFPEHHISKLPKPTKKQTEDVRADFKKGVRCKICGTWHHPDVVHLDYVGHAALTDRLLDTDMEWSWEPVAFDERGLPAFDQNGGLWIRLTVAGVTRLGYGAADGKTGGDAKKEIIGDALRNAAMRFGAALDLWHKGDLHLEDQNGGGDNAESQMSPAADPSTLRDQLEQSVAEAPDRNALPPELVHHDDTGIQPNKPKGWREPDSIYSTPSRLHTGCNALDHDLNGCGDSNMVYGVTAMDEWKEFVRIAEKHAPHYLHGGDPAPEEFEGLIVKAKRLVAEFDAAVANGKVDMVRAG